jgi:hypothetical protein
MLRSWLPHRGGGGDEFLHPPPRNLNPPLRQPRSSPLLKSDTDQLIKAQHHRTLRWCTILLLPHWTEPSNCDSSTPMDSVGMGAQLAACMATATAPSCCFCVSCVSKVIRRMGGNQPCWRRRIHTEQTGHRPWRTLRMAALMMASARLGRYLFFQKTYFIKRNKNLVVTRDNNNSNQDR